MPVPHPLQPFDAQTENDQAWAPSQNGLACANGDPWVAQNAGAAASGTKYVLRVPVNIVEPVSSVWMIVTTAGATLTAAQNLCGVYNAAGAQLAVTGDQSAVWTSTGAKQMALTSTIAITPPYLYVEVMSNGTTPATFARFGQPPSANLNLAGALLRCATNGTGATALDASITPSSLSTLNTPFSFWVGLS